MARLLLIVCLAIVLPWASVGCFVYDRTDRHWDENLTIATLSQLADLVRRADTRKLRSAKTYSELLAIFRSRHAPDGSDELSRFRYDGWGNPFAFERVENTDSTRITVSSKNPHVYLGIEIEVDNRSGAIAVHQSW